MHLEIDLIGKNIGHVIELIKHKQPAAAEKTLRSMLKAINKFIKTHKEIIEESDEA